MSNEKIFENIMSQFYLDEVEDENNNGTNSKKENNNSNHKNVSSMTNESDEDMEKKLANMYNENEDKNSFIKKTRKDKFINKDNINDNEQKSDENPQKFRINIDSNIYENIIEEKNENDDSINKNNEFFENLDEEDNGIDSFRPKQEQKSPEFINKNFSIYNKNANSNSSINNKKNIINNSCNNMNNFTETIKTKIEGDLSIKDSIRINSINEKFNNNLQYTHNPNIISLGKISNKESDSAIPKNNNDRKSSDDTEEQKEEEFLIREELIRKKYKEKMALEKENRKVKNRINLLKNDDDEGKENVTDEDEETTQLENLSIEEKKKNFRGNEENNSGAKISLNLSNNNYNNINKKYNEDIIISSSNPNTNRNRNNDIKIRDMPIKLLNQYIDGQGSNKKRKKLESSTANSSTKKNNKINNSFLVKNEYNKEKNTNKGKTKQSNMNTPIKKVNNQMKRNNNIKKTEIKNIFPSSKKNYNYNYNFSSDNIKNSSASFHINSNSNRRINNIKNDRIISKKLIEKCDMKNIKKNLYPYVQKNAKNNQKSIPAIKTPRPRKSKNSTDYYQNCTFTPNINKISIKLWKKRNKNLEKKLMINPIQKIEENNIGNNPIIKRNNKRSYTPIGDLLYEDANYKKEKMKQIYLTENNNIKYNANLKKINRNSYDMVIERTNKRINNIINKYSKDSQLSIVNIVQCLYDLKIINEIIKNNFQNTDLNFQKLKIIVNNIKEKDYKKLDELEILEQLWLLINPFKQKTINSKLFFEILKILFSHNDININNEKIKEMSSNIEIILKNNIYEYDKRDNIDEYITPLTDNKYEKKDLWSIPKLIKKFLVLKNNIKAYKNTDYEYKKEEINQNLKEEDEKELTFEPNLTASNYTYNRYSKYLPYENFEDNMTLTENYASKNLRYDFNKTYERFMQEKKAHEKVLEKLREIKLNKELKKCTYKPEINKYIPSSSIRRNKSFDLKDSYISYKNRDKAIPIYERLYKMRKINDRKTALKNSKSENINIKHNLMIRNYRNKNRVKESSSNINEINENKNNNELNSKNKVEGQSNIKIDNIYITIEIKIPNGQLKPLKIFKNQNNTNEKVNEFCGMYDIDENNKNLLIQKVRKYNNIFFSKNVEEDNDCNVEDD